MTKWLTSGRRRDMCVILADEGECSGQALKTRLSKHYDQRIDPESFYGALSSLVEAGFVAEREEGLADVYSLTDAGEQRLQNHFRWMQDLLS
jgi:DNA-binding PadR family transcriptional regulator